MTGVIILPTVHTADAYLDRCLQLLDAHTDGDVASVVVEGGTFAENINEGARAFPDAEWYFLLNEDTEVTPGWLAPLTIALHHHHIVGCRLLYPDGEIQHAGVYLDLDDTGTLTAHNYLTEQPPSPMDAVTGAAMMVDAHLFHALNGLDEQYRMGYEDIDFCLRARELAPSCVWYEPATTIIHHESKSGPGRWAHVAENIALLHDRWAWLYAPPDAVSDLPR